MNIRFRNLLAFLVLACGVYALGWLIGRAVNSGLYRVSPSPAIARTEIQAEPAVTSAALPEAKQSGLLETEKQPAALADRRATLQALQVKVLQLDQARKAREACDALENLEPLLRGLAPEDFPAVWRWFCQLQSPAVRIRVQRAVISAWSSVNPHGALEAVLTLPAPGEWVGGEVLAYKPLDMVLSRWAMNDSQGAQAWAEQAPAEQRWVADQLLSWVKRLAAPDSANPAADIAALAVQEPEKAVAWAQTLNSDDPARERALSSAFGALVLAGRSADALELVNLQSEPEKRRQLTAALASTWGNLDIQGALAWASQLPSDEALRKAAWDGLKTRWIQQDPASAVRFALGAFPAGEARTAEFRNIAINSLSHGMGHTYDDDLAYHLTRQLPAGPERDAVAAVLSERWAEFTPEHAARLTASMNPGEEQTRVAVQVVSKWAGWDPAAAAAWVTDFPPGQARETALPIVLGRWMKADPEAAREWARQTGLPAEPPTR